MAADTIARKVGLVAGVLAGLWIVQGVGATVEPAPAADERPTWLYDLPAEPAPPADPEEPAAPAPLDRLPETM